MATEVSWRPKAVVFDLLTALLDSWTLWDESTPTKTAEEGRLWRKRYLELTYSQGQYVAYETLVHRSAADVGLPASSAEYLVKNWDSLKPWPETPQTLIALRRRGYKLGVITNCSNELGTRAVRSLSDDVTRGLGGNEEPFVFDAAITAEQSGFYKPRLEAYAAILAPLGLSPEEVLFVAGSAADVQGATKAGFRVVWHNRIGLPAMGEERPLKESTDLGETLRGTCFD